MGSVDNSQVTIDINADISGFKRGTAEAKASLDSLSSTLKQPAAALEDVSSKSAMATRSFSVMGIGVASLVTTMAFFTRNVLNSADALNDMHARTDVSVKDLAGLSTIAKQSGTSLDAVANGLQHLNVSIGQAEKGNKEYAVSLKNLGVTSKDPKEALYQLADAVKATNDPTKLSADLQKVLSRNYAELLPLLKEGGDGLRKAAAANEEFADTMARLAPDADKFNDNLAQLKTNAAGFAASILADVVPALNTFFDRLDRISKLHAGGASIGELLTGAYSADTAASIKRVNDELRITEKELSLMPPGGFDPLGDRKALEDKLARLKSIKATLRDISLSGAMDLAEQQYKKTPGGASGGIDLSAAAGKPKHVSDPLASLLASTDIGKLAEFDKQVALLNQRFDYGRKSSELYSQAMTKLVQGTFSNNFKEAANDAEFMAMVAADGAKTTAEWNKNLRDLANAPLGRLNDLLKNTDFSRLQKDQEDMVLLTQAFTDGITDADGNLKKLSESQYLDAVKNRLNLVGKAADDNNSLVKELGLTFTSAFEDAVVGGKKFSDVLKALGQDIEKILLRKAVTEPLVKELGSMDWGAIIGAILPSAQGNVFPGQTGLSAYRNTVVSQPTVFPFAQGVGLMGEKPDSPGEAIMPLTRMNGGDLGVKVAGAGGSNVVVNIIEAPGKGGQQNQRQDNNGTNILDVYVEQIKGSIAGDISQGRGAIPDALTGTYGLNRVAGAY
ncbi:MAG: hypothetical protein ABIK08_11355 [Pseudomonadota bacterium]